MTSLLLRPATPSDISAVLAFWQVAAEGTNRSDSRPGVEALLKRDPEALILALDTTSARHSDTDQLDADPSEADESVGQLVGSVIAGWDGWRSHLYRLAVHPDRRRQGIGTALLTAAEKRFEQFGASRFDAMVLTDNELGQQAWRAAGYRPQPEWRRWVKYAGGSQPVNESS